MAVPVVPQTQLEKEMRNEIICMCGTCGRKRIGECTAALWRPRCDEEVAEMVAQGKTREQIYAYYIAKYGSQEPLASPIDEGLQPAGVVLPVPDRRDRRREHRVRRVPLVEARRTRTRQPSRRPAPPTDPALRERLDDELRDLD